MWEIRIHQSTNIYSKNNPAKLHHNPIWNDGACILDEVGLKKKKNKMSSDKGSVADPKNKLIRCFV